MTRDLHPAKNRYFFPLRIATVFLLLSQYAIAQTTQTYTSAATLTVPAGVTSVKVEIWGGGGGGGADNKGGGGGGGGAFTQINSLSVIPGNTISITVGSGGGRDINGNPSVISCNSNAYSANGGLKGNGNNGGNGGDASSVGDIKTAGGNGGNGGNANNSGGGGGGAAGNSAGNGANGANNSSSNGGAGGAGVNGAGSGGAGGNTGQSGADGTIPGGGGGGEGDGNNTSGSGANGLVKITYTCPVYSLTSISASSPTCPGNASTITLSSGAANLPVGTYTVTYSLSAPNAATGITAAMVVTTAGTGSFTTPTLVNAGTTTITITRLESGTCFNTVSSSATISVNPLPVAAGTITGFPSVTKGQTAVSYSVPAIANATSYVWSYSGTGATVSGTTSAVTINFAANATSGNLTVKGTNACGDGTVSVNYAITVNEPAPCPYNGNTNSLIDFTPCINIDLLTWNNTVSNSFAAKQYFLMNVIKGLTYDIYTCKSGLVNSIQMTLYEEGTGNLLATSYSNVGNPCNDPNNVYLSSYTSSFSGKIRVLINRLGDCASTSPSVGVRVRVTGGSNTLDNQNNAGTDSWIGHVYDDTEANLLAKSVTDNFAGYLGYYTETESFNQLFGGNSNNNCFSSVYSNGVSRASLNTQTFAVRYRMTSTRKGLYIVDLGSDDGSRLTVDGSLVYNNWSGHVYQPVARALMSLNGNSQLVYDFYEGGVDNQITFNNLTLILENKLSTNLIQNSCIGSDGSAISGDVYGTLPGGLSLSGTGYQWTYSTTPGGARSNISGATSATFTPSTLSPPFNAPGTYYVYRNAVLSSINNVSPNPYLATSESNAATINIEAPSIISTSPGYRCGSGTVDLSATCSSGTVQWYDAPSGGTLRGTGTSFTTPILSATTTYYAQGTSGGCLFTRFPVVAYIQSSPLQPVAIAGSTGVYQGTSQTYSVTNVPGTTYTWTFPSGWVQTAGGTTNSIVVTAGNSSGTISVTPSNSCGAGISQSLSVTAYNLGISVTKTDLCTSGGNTGSIIANGLGGQTPYQYKLNSGTYQASGSFSSLAAGTYSVWVKDAGGIETSASVTIQMPATSNDDKNREGSDSWIGHVFKRVDSANTPPSDVNAFSNYYGTITETETFNEAFGGTTNCFSVTASESDRRLYSEYFAVRFRMASTKTGIYLADMASDDGARLTIDGLKVYDQWIQRGYLVDAKVLFQLNGSSKLLLEYYDSSGGNQISFGNFNKVPNNLTSGTNQSVCGSSILATITGNNALTDAPISGTTGFTVTYQWQQANALNGPFTDISGVTTPSYTPTVSLPGTYYYRRKLTVTKTNPRTIIITATDYSTVATITIASVPGITTQPVSPSPTCIGTAIPALSVSATIAGTYQWYSNIVNSNAGGSLIPGATFSTYVPPATVEGTVYYYCKVDAAASGCGSVSSTVAAVIVNPLPTAIISGAPTVCKDAASPAITFTGANGTAPYVFTYTINGGVTQSVTTTSGNSVNLPVPTSATGTFNYTLIAVTDANICSQPQSGNATATIIPLLQTRAIQLINE